MAAVQHVFLVCVAGFAAPHRGGVIRTNRVAPLLMQAGDSSESAVVDELVKASDDEMFGIMQRNVHVLLSPSFLGCLRRRGRDPSAPVDREVLQSLEESVLAFLEEFILYAQQLEEARDSDDPDGVAQRADGGGAIARPRKAASPRLRREESPEEEQEDPGYALTARAMVLDLLQAGQRGVDQLDDLLDNYSSWGMLNEDFLSHLRLEMDEQVRIGNNRLVYVLQIAVQRVCLAMEGSLGANGNAAHHLSELLQRHTAEARETYWRKAVCPLPEEELRNFECNLERVFADVALRVTRGADVPDELLRQLQVVRDELPQYIGAQN